MARNINETTKFQVSRSFSLDGTKMDTPWTGVTLNDNYITLR